MLVLYEKTDVRASMCMAKGYLLLQDVGLCCPEATAQAAYLRL